MLTSTDNTNTRQFSHVDNHIGYLDSFAKTHPLKQKYTEELNILIKLLFPNKEIESKRDELKEKREYYAFRLKEIDAVSPQPGEDVELERELNILENAEKLMSLTSSSFQSFMMATLLLTILFTQQKDLESLAKIDSQFLPFSTILIKH
ncbi:MAG: hypothetical protein IPJ75_09660 [Ignavibacteriales bacterium]|nr:hypothetical protein [Ignavibacteriales bacterium]